MAALASEAEVLRNRDIASLSSAERRILARQFAALPIPAPTRITRRLEPAGHGQIDRVRTVRDQRRRGGEPGPLRDAQRRRRTRRTACLIGGSGSMKPCA